jgi:drug/metabolite transporter (DMT)-like permease
MGALYGLLSAAGFGVMAIFAKLAYDDGVDVQMLLVARFGIAALVLLAITGARGTLRRLGGRTVLIGLEMGGVGYALQASLYFAALARVDASQVALIFSSYPLLVMVAAVLTRRERATRRRAVALALAWAGIALVITGGSAGAFDPSGAALALGSAVLYTCYILVGDRVASHIPATDMAALVSSGAFISFATFTLAGGGPSLDFQHTAWIWLVAIALVSTVGAILLFFAALARLGPTVTSLLGVLEPVVTVTAAAVVFGEALSALQGVGGLAVLAAVLVVQWPARTRTGGVPPALATSSNVESPVPSHAGNT